MNVLVCVSDPDLRRCLLRALAVMGHLPRSQTTARLPEAVLVDAGPNVVVLRVPHGGCSVLPKPFELKALHEALGPT